MSKHKTRQQKIIAQLRRELRLKSQDTALAAPAKPQGLPLIKTIQQQSSYPIQNAYPYLLPDLLKTFILTGSIVVLELLLFFLSKKHILQLPI